MNLILPKAATDWLRQAYRQRALKRATARAYKAFVQQEPQWQEVLFDEYFITHRGAAVLTAYARGLAPGPVALAQACADQWGWDLEGRVKFVAALTPAAARFLDLFEHELGHTGAASGALSPRCSSSLTAPTDYLLTHLTQEG